MGGRNLGSLTEQMSCVFLFKISGFAREFSGLNYRTRSCGIDPVWVGSFLPDFSTN
jgi:hypothetical protein